MNVPCDVRRVDHRAAASGDYAKVVQERDRIGSWEKEWTIPVAVVKCEWNLENEGNEWNLHADAKIARRFLQTVSLGLITIPLFLPGNSEKTGIFYSNIPEYLEFNVLEKLFRKVTRNSALSNIP